MKRIKTMVSIVRGNYFRQRPGETEPLVTFNPNEGTCVLHLRDYAVIPLEEYQDLMKRPGFISL